MHKSSVIISTVIFSVALSSCVKEFGETGITVDPAGTPVELHVCSTLVSDEESKTAYTPGSGIAIDGTENIGLWYIPDGSSVIPASAGLILAKPAAAQGTYSFTVPSGAETADWYGVMPYSSGLTKKTSSGASFSLRLGPVQFPKANSFDPQADFLLAENFSLDVTAGQTSAEISSFKRLFAPLRIRITGLREGEKIYAFTLKSSQEPTKYSALGGLGYVTPWTSFDNAKISNYQVGSNGNAMSAVYDGGLEALDIEGASTWPVWLMVAPTTLKSGTTLTFTVSTATRTITRTVTLGSDIVFKIFTNRINDLGINISGSGSSYVPSATYVFLNGNTNGWTMTGNKSYTESDSALPAGALQFSSASGSFTFPTIEGSNIVSARIFTHPASGFNSSKTISLTVDGTDTYNFNLTNTTALGNGTSVSGGVLDIVLPSGKTSLGGLKVTAGSDNNHIISAITLYTEDPEDEGVDKTLFSLINWDYAPLATVKALYEDHHYKKAADALLEYFKNRTDVVNPEVTAATASDVKFYQKLAEDSFQENGYRFCVHAGYFYESYDKSTGTYTYYSFDDGEGNIDWEFLPDGVGSEFYQKHWHSWFQYLAKMYDYYEDEKYFNAWKSQYYDWMENYPCPSTGKKYTDSKITDYGYKSWCELSMATRIKNQTDLFEYFKSADGFDFNFLTKFLVAFDECVQYSMSHLYYTEKSNIRLSQYKSHCLAGILFPELKNAENWLTTGANQISNAFSISFLEDGCLEELDFGYHTGEIENYRLVYNAAKANNRLDKFPADYLDKLHNACSFAADYIYPFYQNEIMNDTKESTKNVLKRFMNNYSEMFPSDNKFLYLGSDRAQGTKPTETLSLYKTSGYYFFHAGWEEDAMMLIYKNNYNPDNMWHSHLDNGNIGICNKGRMFLPSPGSYTYGGTTETDAQRAIYKATRNHNTITRRIANIPDNYSKGRFLTSYTKNGIDCVVAENTSYANLTHRRAVWMVDKSFFVIADACYGADCSTDTQAATLNLNWHLLWDETLGADCVAYDDCRTSYGYGAHTVFTDGNNMVIRSFSDTSTGFYVQTGTSPTSPQIGTTHDRKFYRINVNKETADSTPRFITVICPCASASEVTVSASFPNAWTSAGETVNVTLNGKSYTLSYEL